jgi:osmotically-inducible protein OsmY
MKTDIQLQQDVIAELKWDPKINAAHIGVQAQDGVVTLSGHVDSYAEKWNAEDAAKRVTGVKVLAIDIDVILPNSSQKSDSEIALAISNAMKVNTYHLDALVKARVEDGLVTLTGVVEWQFQKIAASNAIRYLTGVKGIFNNILVKPKVSITAVKSDIDAAINRRAQSDIQNIKVLVDGSDVTLTGKVHDWSEKNLVIDAAWAVPGVRKVVDRMAFA